MKSVQTVRAFEKPQMVVDLQRAGNNITRVCEKMKRHGVFFRPHFKTHQCAAIGEQFRAFGVTAITVSSLDMAAYFAKHGWSDITLAVPVSHTQLQAINPVAKQVRLNLLVDCPLTARALSNALEVSCPVWVKVDVGYGRAGVKWHDEQGVLDLVRLVKSSDRLEFAGLLTHSGHTYECRGRAEVVARFEEGRVRMVALAQMLERQGVSARVSMGDTPSASLAENFEGVDEMRPGNFVFYDVTQCQIGSCGPDDIAVAVACPVIGKYPDDPKVIVYGGSVHLSKDSLTIEGHRRFGQLALPAPDGWEVVPHSEAQVFGCCQEVSQIKVSRALFDRIELGQSAYILPAHSCLAAEIYPRYVTTGGQTLERFRLYG